LTVLRDRETASVAYIIKGRQYDFRSSTVTSSELTPLLLE